MSFTKNANGKYVIDVIVGKKRIRKRLKDPIAAKRCHDELTRLRDEARLTAFIDKMSQYN